MYKMESIWFGLTWFFFYLYIELLSLSYSDTHILDLTNQHSPFTCIITSDGKFLMGRIISNFSKQPEEHSTSQRGGDHAQRIQLRLVWLSEGLLYGYERYYVGIVAGILNHGLSHARSASMTSWSKITVSCSFGSAMKSWGWRSHIL